MLEETVLSELLLLPNAVFFFLNLNQHAINSAVLWKETREAAVCIQSVAHDIHYTVTTNYTFS